MFTQPKSGDGENCCRDYFDPTPFFSEAGTCFTTKTQVKSWSYNDNHKLLYKKCIFNIALYYTITSRLQSYVNFFKFLLRFQFIAFSVISKVFGPYNYVIQNYRLLKPCHLHIVP